MIGVTWSEPEWRGPIKIALPYDGRAGPGPRKVWVSVELGPFDTPEEHAQALCLGIAVDMGMASPQAWEMVLGSTRPKPDRTGLLDRLREDFPGAFK